MERGQLSGTQSQLFPAGLSWTPGLATWWWGRTPATRPWQAQGVRMTHLDGGDLDRWGTCGGCRAGCHGGLRLGLGVGLGLHLGQGLLRDH